MEYLPFGETLVEEHLNSNNSPFKFNAKELDEETGNYYYGARYYNPKWSIWLSVDPMAEKYPGWSPYNYTFQNPINFVDPDGNDPINPRTGKAYKINLWNHSPISNSINFNKNNRDDILYNRVDRNFLGIKGFPVPRERNSMGGTWTEGASSISRDLSSNMFSNKARSTIASELGVESVHASGAPTDNLWRKAAESGTYSFVAPSYAENEFRSDHQSIDVIQVKDNYISKIINLNKGDGGEYDVNRINSFSVEEGDIQTREVGTLFGIFSKTEKYRTLNVTEKIQHFDNGQLKREETRNYTTEKVID